jgi:hypothetical protein
VAPTTATFIVLRTLFFGYSEKLYAFIYQLKRSI